MPSHRHHSGVVGHTAFTFLDLCQRLYQIFEACIRNGMWSTIAHTLQSVVWAGNFFTMDISSVCTQIGARSKGCKAALGALDRNRVRDKYPISASQRAAMVDRGQNLFCTTGV